VATNNSEADATGVNETDQRAAELETTPKDVVSRWLIELELADKAEESWRKQAGEIYERYEGKNQEAFNILWSNTETVIPTVYNSTPVPDVRRRFRDADPVGKWASKVVERALEYSIDPDVYDFSDEMAAVVLDAELLGRGVARVPYKPTFAPLPPLPITPDARAPIQPNAHDADASAGEAAPIDDSVPTVKHDAEPDEQVVDERTELEHVQWDTFRHGAAKRWRDVPWVGFEHEFSKDQATQAFGADIADALTYTQVEHADEAGKSADASDDVRSQFKVVKVYEIWDKNTRRVLFIAPSYKDAPCAEIDDPLQMEGFLPMPRPVYTINNTRSLVPRARYAMYEKKAQQLEKISARVDKIVNALRVRGMYASSISEVEHMLDGDDNTLTPVANMSAIMDGGGLDKMIWIMPIDKLAAVLRELYTAAQQCKQEIYEIVGLSDIMRGATDPNETLGAQELKAQTGSVRLENYKRNIQRFARDGLRLMAEVICSKFSQKTLKTITGVYLPTAEQKMQAKQAMMMAQQPPMPQAPGMPPPAPQISPEGLEAAKKIAETPSWGEVMNLLRNDFLRSTRIDIETDSTVSETINRDMTTAIEAVKMVGEIFTASLPIVQSGMIGPEVPKELALSLMRKARGGQVVEDALENVQQPAPEAQPAQEGEDPAKAVQEASKVAKLEGELATERQQRALDKREFELKLREAEVTMKEQQLAKQREEVERVSATVSEQAGRMFAPPGANGMPQ
jgi:hypothetical protein